MQLEKKWRSFAAVLASACVCGGFAGCSDDGASLDASPDTTQEADASTGDETEVEASDEPAEDPSDTDDPTAFAFGQVVRIVDGGVEPRLLAADVSAPITIRNDTDSAQEVRFTNPGWDEATTTTTGPLAPGESFELDPIGVASITYEVAGLDGVVGTIQVEDGLDTL